MWRFRVLICFCLQIFFAKGFVHPKLATVSMSRLAKLQLSGKRVRNTDSRSSRASKTTSQKKKKKRSSKQSTAKKPPKSARASQVNEKPTKKATAHTPPWQIVSKKDAKKNIEAEKRRRKLAQEGIHNVEPEEEFKVSKSFLSAEDKSLLAWKRFSPNKQYQVDFLGAYLDNQLPPRIGAPEVAFLGRSNVGKSSLLNKLVGSTIARVGKTPGATASVNLYGMYRGEKPVLGLVDLPGFGYAKLSKENKESVQMAAEKYLGKRRELFLGVLLVDIRRVPSDDDRAVLAALYDMGVPIIVVATKMDKLSPTEGEKSLTTIRDGLGLPDGQPLCISSLTGNGIKDLWRILLEACEIGVDELSRKVERGEGIEDDLEVHGQFEDDVAYSQGFDWIHDSGSYVYDGEIAPGFDGDIDQEFEDDYVEHDNETTFPDPNKKESLKSLRKRAKEMERRGEL